MNTPGLGIYLMLGGVSETVFFQAIVKGLFLGLILTLGVALFFNFKKTKSPVVLNSGIFLVLVAFFVLIVDLNVYSTAAFGVNTTGMRLVIFLTAAVCFQLLMVLRYVTGAFQNKGVTDTYLAMCFGLSVFLTIVGPFLDVDMSVAAAIVLLLFIGLFASGFSLVVLKEDESNGLLLVSCLILPVIASAIGLLTFLGISVFPVYQQYVMHAVISFAALALTFQIYNKYTIGSAPQVQVEATPQENTSFAKLIANDRLKDEHVAMVAHEIRTPLGGIIGISELLAEGAEGDLSPQVNLNLKLIADSSRRLNYLLNDLLDLSKIKYESIQVNFVPVHLRTIINKVMALQYPMAAIKGIELRNLVSRDTANVTADPGKLEQILHNLIGNSVKFTDEGYVSIDAEMHENWVVITIEDTGKGLSKENLEDILNSIDGELVQPSEKGHSTGFGLKISNKLIEMHGSKLSMESAQGFGSYFSFRLPVTEEKAEINDEYENYTIGPKSLDGNLTQIRPHRNARIGEKFKIMVIDDEPINIKVLTAQLNRAGYDVQSFFNGQSGLQALQTGDLPDLVLLDIMMPQMNGFEVCASIRKEYSPTELPVIMLTAKNHTNDILEAFKTGANDYIAKPIAKDELLARIKTQVELSKINHAFSRFVPHEFLNFLGYDNVIEIKLGDQVEKHMTVMFSDIKDFTKISEDMSPKEAFDFINTFLGTVSPLIRKHGGFIDKFIGDAIMALFPGSADDALEAALNMTSELKNLNIERIEKGLIPIYVGTGLHTGDLMLGMIGEQQRMEGTVISDVVNTASRLEGLTKVFDSSIIISSQTKELLKKEQNLHFRYLGKTLVKGKHNVLDVFGVVEGDDDAKIKLELTSADAFEAGIKEFYNKNFTSASVHFNEVLKTNPRDKAASIFLKRSAHLMITGVSEDWNGVEESIILLENG